MTKQIIGFPFFESQAKWIAQLLSGKKSLPTWEEMMKSIKAFYQSKDAAGIPKHNTHDIADFEVNTLYTPSVALNWPHYILYCFAQFASFSSRGILYSL